MIFSLHNMKRERSKFLIKRLGEEIMGGGDSTGKNGHITRHETVIGNNSLTTEHKMMIGINNLTVELGMLIAIDSLTFELGMLIGIKNLTTGAKTIIASDWIREIGMTKPNENQKMIKLRNILDQPPPQKIPEGSDKSKVGMNLLHPATICQHDNGWPLLVQ